MSFSISQISYGNPWESDLSTEAIDSALFVLCNKIPASSSEIRIDPSTPWFRIECLSNFKPFYSELSCLYRYTDLFWYSRQIKTDDSYFILLSPVLHWSEFHNQI